VTELLTAKDLEQAHLFKNRLEKLARHLRRWPTKRGISCFRIYDKDIPEIPLVVDRYDNHLHITEYERPHERNPPRHAAWLELMCQTASDTLDVAPECVHLKSRVKHASQQQYEKVGDAGHFVTVQEDGLKFLVNLTDYVDTGLFLDHRQTRKMVRQDAKEKEVLNLFAYTGSFSVYAAAGGARCTTTVDLSHTYLRWAKRNFEINGFSGEQHHFIASDTLGFLRSLIGSGNASFDLAIVDPPTHSNSKKTSQDWNVQTDHVELLKCLRALIRLNGIVYFSTNFRRFKLEEEQLNDYQIREISQQTVPEDFRNKRIHRCWRMVAV
jgi:23S rRNA (guanine2445-N2)-methyltransferase / 23S rRNA (guanine2069-N7)-methyltransferase